MSVQQITREQAAGLALAARRGRAPKWHLKGQAKKMYDELSMEELEAIAEPEEHGKQEKKPS